MNCTNCPDNCLGNDVPIRCFYDEETGKSLISIIEGFSPGTAVVSTAISTDNITSKSLIRNTSYICSSQIVKRDFVYSLQSTVNSVLFSWDFLPVISALPTGFKTALVKVKITGNSPSGANLITESKTPSGGIPINLTNFPINVDIDIRLTSPCGNIDLTSQFSITNPTITGEFRTNFSAKDLNPQTGEINLTQQLNSIEGQLATARYELENYKVLIAELRSDIQELKDAN